MSLNFSQIPPLSTEIVAFERLKNIIPSMFSRALFIQIFLILADNQKWHNILSVKRYLRFLCEPGFKYHTKCFTYLES